MYVSVRLQQAFLLAVVFAPARVHARPIKGASCINLGYIFSALLWAPHFQLFSFFVLFGTTVLFFCSPSALFACRGIVRLGFAAAHTRSSAGKVLENLEQGATHAASCENGRATPLAGRPIHSEVGARLTPAAAASAAGSRVHCFHSAAASEPRLQGAQSASELTAVPSAQPQGLVFGDSKPPRDCRDSRRYPPRARV